MVSDSQELGKSYDAAAMLGELICTGTAPTFEEGIQNFMFLLTDVENDQRE